MADISRDSYVHRFVAYLLGQRGCLLGVDIREHDYPWARIALLPERVRVDVRLWPVPPGADDSPDDERWHDYLQSVGLAVRVAIRDTERALAAKVANG